MSTCMMQPQALLADEDGTQSDGADSDRFSGSNSSFLANEKLVSVDSMNSDTTDDDSHHMPDDELQLCFNKLVPPVMQRGRVEGQEIPATGLLGAGDDLSKPSSTEPEQYRYQFFDDYNQVGESNRPSFRPGLEGGSSDDEDSTGRGAPFLSGIEHRRSAEGQVISSPLTDASQNVVYQSEDGEWVTDLAYYSSFEKEVDSNTPEDIGQFQAEDFVPSGDAMKKILKDQEEFEKEHQFMQEEKIEPANSSCTFNCDSSWKIPNNSHVLTSQVSSEFEKGNHSYLRLSLGEFFERRSEALGCLGNTDDEVKRSLRSGGQQQKRGNTSPEKKPLVRTVSAPPLPPSSGEKHFSISKPAVNPAAGLPSADLAVKHIPAPSGPLGISGPHPIPRPHQSQQDIDLLGKPYPQYGVESLMACQVVVPEELRFPHACCVGIASQTSLSLFNPSERWQQVSVTVTSLAIDGEKVRRIQRSY
ncbi:unnamed protein product [Tetraodon nigroviridis]|uniref:(spotted green pufferfish) hypothetical protein n=1 Tax=Tetraodon nigroviridis TaxID=99883 RepID=Q4S2V6_TETNG|nr:unnamed protein product [Tetraodon nigroviridis]